MARPTPTFRHATLAAAAALLGAGWSQAQTVNTPPSATATPTPTPTPTPAPASAATVATDASTAPIGQLGTVNVTGRADPVVGVGGWGGVPLSKAPFQASVLSAEQLRDRGVTRLSDITRIDASVSDAYNTEGYWDYLTVRGFVIDNRSNYRRDGLPINAETAIALDNKDSIEVLKGTSGLQAGTSAPGGLVNFVVKRPLDTSLRRAELRWRERGSVAAAVDLSERFGTDRSVGLRVNAAVERLDPKVRDADGERQLLSLAGDWRLGRDTLVEAEVESSRRSQPSVPGFSLLGNAVPTPVDPRINLNNQPWSQPVVLQGNTASLRLTHRLSADWQARAHLGTQRLRSDDRIAFPYGCYDAAADVYYSDRYCPNGTYDLYDFRSDNERRRTNAAELSIAGTLTTGPVAHRLEAGLLRSSFSARFQRQAYNYVGQGNVQGTLFTPADPTLTDENTDRNERSTELFVRDAVQFGGGFGAWLGLRHTRLQRDSVRTNGSRPTNYAQQFTTPWLALTQALGPRSTVYVSWGEGVESDVVPNRARYTNRGEALPALRSKQTELGLKTSAPLARGGELTLSAALFDVRRPAFADLGTDCGSDTPGGTCTRRADGEARHTGLEAQAGWRSGPWLLQGSALWLRARRDGSADPTINGLRPANVPDRTVKWQARYDVPAIAGLSLRADWVAEGNRMVLPDNSARIGGWSRVDAGLRYQTASTTPLVWRAGVDNLFDRRAWREAPYQFGHAYLFPLPARTLRLSVEAFL